MNLNKFFIPKTFFGKLSIILIISFFLLFVIFWLFVFSGERGGEKYFSNLKLAIPVSIAGICAIVSFITGLISVFKKERCIFVFIAILIGFFVLLFVAAEILFPH